MFQAPVGLSSMCLANTSLVQLFFIYYTCPGVVFLWFIEYLSENSISNDQISDFGRQVLVS